MSVSAAIAKLPAAATSAPAPPVRATPGSGSFKRQLDRAEAKVKPQADDQAQAPTPETSPAAAPVEDTTTGEQATAVEDAQLPQDDQGQQAPDQDDLPTDEAEAADVNSSAVSLPVLAALTEAAPAPQAAAFGQPASSEDISLPAPAPMPAVSTKPVAPTTSSEVDAEAEAIPAPTPSLPQSSANAPAGATHPSVNSAEAAINLQPSSPPSAPAPDAPAIEQMLPPPAPEVDNAEEPNVARLARGLRAAVNQNGGAITLRLTPPELGAVRIQMQVVHNHVSAQLQVEQDSVQNLLSHRLGQLRQALESQGLVVDKLQVQTVDVRQNSSDLGQAPDDGRSRGQYTPQQQQPRQHDLPRDAGGQRRSFRDALINSVA